MATFNFSNQYSRNNFTQFIQEFLPDDFTPNDTVITGLPLNPNNYIQTATKLGDCKSLELEVFEIQHTSTHDARVGLSREAFQMLLRHSSCNRALVVFVPQDSSQYRFSLLQMEAEQKDNSARITRSYSNPRRYSFLLGEGEKVRTPQMFLIDEGKVKARKRNGKDFTAWDDLCFRFSVEILTKEFYKELFDWYQWALSDEMAVTYPNDTSIETDDRIIQEHLIRLITRLMFVWFIKQKKLIPEQIFDENELKDILQDFDTTSTKSSNYYNAILQNLFFATLNRPINERGFASDASKSYQGKNEQYGIKTLFRDANEGSWFRKSHEDIIQIFRKVPFLNGGLFECLDKEQDNNGKIFYYDGFSRVAGRQKRAFIPNCLFFDAEKGLISILKRYNFTIEENTPTDVEVALDPELLGKVFENLLGAYNPETKETARKQSGSFYTPREIVNYMVDESIRAYLQQTVGDDAADIVHVETLHATSLPDPTKQKIYNALLQIKILDPACGSGAFPMGILNRIITIMQHLPLPSTISIYDLKLHLIENCIFGVDIQPIAVQISKLRFFISLVCEQVANNSNDNFGIKPLPNLETKFVTANTLIGLKLKDVQGNLFEDPQIEVAKKDLLQVRHEHFLANTPKQKKECRAKDEELRKKLAKLLEKNKDCTHEEAEQLSAWNPYDQNLSSPFFDAEWMFGLTQENAQLNTTNGYFDIVIGNPPYVEAKKLKEISSKLNNYDVYSGTADLSVYFIEFGINLCKTNGLLMLITTNKFFNTGYGKLVRKKILENQIHNIVDFEQVEVFDNVLVSSVVIGIKNGKSQKEEFIYQKFYKLKKDEFKIQFVGKQNAFGTYKQSLLDENEWSFSDNTKLELKNNIEKAGKKLSELEGISVFRGVTTGYNPAFIINESKKNELVEVDKNNEQIIKPLLQGRNIRKWIYNYDNDYLIFTKQGIDIEKYPLIKEHLNDFYSELKPRGENEQGGRKPGNYKWFEIQDNTAYYPEFEKDEKIIWGLTADKWAYAYDDGQHYLPSNGYILTSKTISIKYLLGLLNSNLLKFYFGFTGVMTAGGAYTLKHATIQQLPIPAVPLAEQQPIILLVDKILSVKKENPTADTSALEAEIDKLVYELYGLTEEEIKIVEKD